MHSVTLSRQFGASGHGSSLRVRARLLTLTTVCSTGESLRLLPCLQFTCRSLSCQLFFLSPGQSALV